MAKMAMANVVLREDLIPAVRNDKPINIPKPNPNGKRMAHFRFDHTCPLWHLIKEGLGKEKKVAPVTK